MPAPLSADLRRRIHAAALTHSASAVAARFDVSVRTVHRLRRLVRATGATEPRAHAGGRTPHLTPSDRPFFEACLREDVSMTQAEMATRFVTATGRTVTRQTVQIYLRRLGITRKKKRSTPHSESART